MHPRFRRIVKGVLPVAAVVSVLTIALICASIIGQNSARIKASGARLLLAVFLLHAGGFCLGYLFARLFGYDKIICRTISVEVGMQNSGLAVALAQKNFPALPAASVPGAISSVFHSVLGSLVAGYWRRTTAPPPPPHPGTPR